MWILRKRSTVLAFVLSAARSCRTLCKSWVMAAVFLTSSPGSPAADVDVSRLPASAKRQIDFGRDIQPILADRCYSCHGPAKQKGELRWDVKAIALQGGLSGPAIVPGKSGESRMIHLVSGLQPDLVMPQKGERLSAEQIGLLRAWIDQGAQWPDSLDSKDSDKKNHWAFRPPTRPVFPAVKNESWIRNPIDHFVLARLEKEKFPPSPQADRITLIRRLSLDLIGLPPSPTEVDAFLADPSPDAERNVVERLLASPHYGERWGRHWLDVARYADSNGFEKDATRSIWPYRDWVIEAFNRDLPFDQFAIEQVAGDLLSGATLRQRVATGFFRNSMLNEEGGVDPEQFRTEGIIDRMDALGKAFLGLTINCAQCHNHKYDPITQREYYQLFAFLNNDDEPEIDVPSAEQQAKREQILQKIKTTEDELIAKTPDLAERLGRWEAEVKSLAGDWTIAPPDSWFAANGTKFIKLDDGSLLARGDRVGDSTYTYTVRTPLTNITGFRLDLLTEPQLPRGGPGRSETGNIVLSEFAVNATPVGHLETTNKIALTNASADFSQPEFPVASALDGNLKTGWAIEAGPARNQDRNAVFQTAEPVGFEGGTILTFTLAQKHGGVHTIGRYRLSLTTAKNPVADPVPSKVRRILASAPSEQTPEQERAVFSYYRTTDTNSNYAAASKIIDEQLNQWPYGPITLVLLARDKPRETHIFKRGDWRKHGDVVSPGVPSILHPLPAHSPLNRLTLARWLVDPRNPTTARVVMNRVWQSYFGHGLITTPEDLGVQGEKPSHPELLDYLATEFINRKWSLKEMHRLIVSSATYRQSSKVPAPLQELDPYNRLLARGSRFRAEAEIIRDIALASSGLLSPKIGGPPAFPPIPDGVLSLGYGNPMKWEASTGADRYRRGMYTFWKRSVPYPGLLVFDTPTGDMSCARRLRSNTPLQALTTLNDVTFHEAAQALALRAFKEGGANDESRLTYAYRLCTARKPDPFETKELLSLLDRQKNYFEDRTAAAVEVSSPDPRKLPADVNLHKVAAWTMVARVLLNMDETITKE